MKKKFPIALLLFLVMPVVLSAASPSELQRQIERVKREREVLFEEQKKLQQELEAVNKESQSLGNAVKSLDATKKKLAKDISITQSKITSTNLTIQSLENTISEKERQIFTHRKAIANALLALSEYDSRPLVLNMLASVRLSDIWKDSTQLEDLNNDLTKEIDSLRETRKVLNKQKEDKEKVKEEQLSLKGQLSGQKSVVEENQKAKEKLLAETKNKEAEYQKLLTENLARQKEFEEDLYNLETQLSITLDLSLIPKARHSVLFWPLDNVFVTNNFGFTKDKIYSSANAFHNGVDFRASMGTPVKAVLAGVINGTGNTDEMNAKYRREGKPICVSYGRWILIKHHNGLSSVYAHLSGSIVKTGQSVKTGEIIGYSGGAYGVNGSGYSFGPHLHMGLLASQGVEIRQLTNSKGGCKEIFMPIARGIDAYLDPLAYLPSL